MITLKHRMQIKKRPSIKSLCVVGLVAMLFTQTTLADEFRLGLITPPSHVWTKAASNFGEELKKLSGGDLSVKVFPARQLGNEAQMMQQLQTGALDMAFLTMAEISNRVPEFGAFYAPYLVKNIEDAGSLLRSDSAEKMLRLLPRAAGVIGIGYGMAGLRQITSRDSVNSVNDLKGKKLRITPFEPIKDFYTAAGVTATPIPLPGVYDALANGQVDAIDMDLELIWKLKYYEQSKDVLVTNHMMFPMIGLVSGRVWKDLSKDDQNLIRKTMKKYLDGVIDTTIELEHGFLKNIKTTDVNVKELDASWFKDATDDWNKTWSKKSKGALQKLRRAVEKL